ncbi:exodeoxyribonuclease VII small subunit [Candidatus Saccharibacteria bacterium]|jgi:exonuclease VII small subunit|nr:exodeoxyribonuclease VII small subunit [Candidatus Saccharibacteria bacterium]
MTKKDKNVSDKIADLKNGVDWFYSDDFKLEEASEKYKELTALAKEIEKDLAEMKNEIKVIEEDFSK